MAPCKPDVIARIRMYPREQGGKNKVISGKQFSCPLYYHQKGFDCRLLLDEQQSLHPGDTAEIPLQFLCPEDIKPQLKQGETFTLWDLRTFAEGEIVQVFEEEPGKAPGRP
jgi:hypothetical protein